MATAEEDGEQLRLLAVEDPAAELGGFLGPPPHTAERPPRMRRVWLRNFKGFEDFDVTLGSFNVVAGANNAGKSTLLQGVDLLFSLIKLHAESNHLARSRLVPPPVLPVASGRDLFYRQVWRQANVYVNAVVGAEFTDGSAIEFGLRYMFGNVNSRVHDQAGIEDARLVALLARPAVWVPSAVGIVRDEEYRPPARQRGLVSAGRHNEVLRNLLVDVKQGRPARFDALQLVLKERFSGTIGEAEFDAELDQFVRVTFRGEGGVEHDLYSSGAGFVQIVQMLAFIFAREPSVVLLDEPDAHLHSSLQRVVVEILDDLSRSEGFQVLIATHSKEIINFVDPTRLILVEAGAGSASLVTTEVTPIAVLKSLGAIDNVDAYTLVKNKRCLFVEGTGDATILGRFAATLGIRALTGDDRVVTMPVGGADRFEHVQQLDVFESMLGEPLRSLEIRDRDGRTQEHRQVLVDRSQRPLHILELDSIESYLLNPTVIARVIAEIFEERSKQAEPPSADEIESHLCALSDEMRQEVEDRIAERYTQDRWAIAQERATVVEANAAARAFVEARWYDVKARIAVMPGKVYLSRARRLVQDVYGVNFGNERLAESFLQDEIPGELQSLLQQVSQL